MRSLPQSLVVREASADLGLGGLAPWHHNAACGCSRRHGDSEDAMIDIEIMPLAKMMGIKIISATPERVVAEMSVRDDLCTTHSVLHGGAVMAFADSIGAVATML